MKPCRLPDLAVMCEGTLTTNSDGECAATVTQVVTDSREAGPGCLFVALAGERTDGHRHVATAVRQGAVAALVSDADAARISLQDAGLDPAALPLIVVADTVVALGRLARAYLASLRQVAEQRGRALNVVGVTGSVGKTTTKDLARQIFATDGPTIAPIASFNNEIGLPLTILRADESTRYLVLEMGASGPGHIAYLTDIAPLDVAAVLMVGHAHMGGFGSIDGVAAAKSEIIAGLLPHGVAVLNADDPRCVAMKALAPGRVLTFSATGAGDADVSAQDVTVDDRAHASMTCTGAALAQPTRLQLALPGAHNVSNALAAVGMALAAGMDSESVCAALGTASIESPHRMDVREVGEMLIVDDSYNANIDSMTAALAALSALAGQRRRVAIISDMLELGDSTRADHQRTGELAAQAGVAVLVTIGTASRDAACRAAECGVQTLNLPDASAAVELCASDATPLRRGDVILVKGSHGSGAWRVADYLLSTTSKDNAS